jgi:hypothetical protein
VPLPPPGPRDELHLRRIEFRGYGRPDGLFEIEGRISDCKRVPFTPIGAEKTVAPGELLHDMWVRVVVDDHMLVHEAVAASDATPFGICTDANAAVAGLKGARIAAGWRSEVMQRVGGVRGCAHVAELLIGLGTAALQTLTEARRKRPEPLDATDVPRKIDSCYAFARDREVVARIWPQHSTRRKDQ